MKRFFLLFSISALLLTAIFAVLPLNGEDGVYNNTVRLHIIANSDSANDQSVKLSVRDAVLSSMSDAVRTASDRAEANERLSERLDAIAAIAERTLHENGFDYSASVTLGEEYYPTRRYDGFALPAGRYCSLRIVLGEGEGHNWWCVLFPPLCIDSSKADELMLDAGFTPEQIRLLTESESPKYVLRFRLLELLGRLREALSGR